MSLLKNTENIMGRLLLLTSFSVMSMMANAESRSLFPDDNETMTRSSSRNTPKKNALPPAGLSEMDVLDVDPTLEITDEDIQTAFQKAKNVTLPQGSSIMLVQSGLKVPDLELQMMMGEYYKIATFPGLPPQRQRITRKNEPQIRTNSYIKNLRLVAAKGRQRDIVVFWDDLQVGQKDDYSPNIYWRNFYGADIPKETLFLRYAIRIAIVSVENGEWSMYTPPLHQQVSFTYPSSRNKENNVSIIEQIHRVKTKAYQSAVNDLVLRYSGGALNKPSPVIEPVAIPKMSVMKPKIVAPTRETPKQMPPERVQPKQQKRDILDIEIDKAPENPASESPNLQAPESKVIPLW